MCAQAWVKTVADSVAPEVPRPDYRTARFPAVGSRYRFASVYRGRILKVEYPDRSGMRVASCSDCGRSLDVTVERHFRVSPAFTDGRGASDAEETVFCVDCGVVRLNTDPSLPAGAVEAHAPTGARR